MIYDKKFVSHALKWGENNFFTYLFIYLLKYDDKISCYTLSQRNFRQIVIKIKCVN